MPQTAAQKLATGRYREKNGRRQVNLELTPETRERWLSYAQSRGQGLTAMARECVQRCMAMDGYENAPVPGLSPAPVSSPAQAHASRPAHPALGIEGLEGMD